MHSPRRRATPVAADLFLSGLARGSSNPNVLAQIGTPTLPPNRPNCAPEIGCAPLQARFLAVRAGTAVLSATRNTCGEAVECPPVKQHFAVTVIVTGG